MKVANESARPIPFGVKPAAERLEALLVSQGETALLRFSIGNAYLDSSPAQAIEHLRRAVVLDPEYSAAWKLLGRALVAHGESADAQAAFTNGIAVAERRGDVQAAKEMRVFLKRLQKE
jgi:predicted Zn-dependent protease